DPQAAGREIQRAPRAVIGRVGGELLGPDATEQAFDLGILAAILRSLHHRVLALNGQVRYGAQLRQQGHALGEQPHQGLAITSQLECNRYIARIPALALYIADAERERVDGGAAPRDNEQAQCCEKTSRRKARADETGYESPFDGATLHRFHGRDHASASFWLGARRSRYVDLDKTRNDARSLTRPVPSGLRRERAAASLHRLPMESTIGCTVRLASAPLATERASRNLCRA